MIDLSIEIKTAINAAIEAGKVTLRYYGKNLNIADKSDKSPLTEADLASNKIINDKLKSLDIPVLSEENPVVEYEIRKNWAQYWLIDPLDGTKEFINKSNEYTINIALMQNNYPVAGIIYIPVLDVIYFGKIGEGAFKIENAGLLPKEQLFLMENVKKLPLVSHKGLVIIASRSHLNEDTKQFIQNISEKYKSISVENYGSSVKFCMIAEGKADIYPRLGPTMEWDIAAGHAIVEAAGFTVVEYPSGQPIKYNKESLFNPWFVVHNQKLTGKLS